MATDDKTARVHLDLVEGLHFHASFPDLPGARPIDIDEEPPAGGGTGANPAGMFGAALGGCLAASLTFCMKKARVNPANVSVDVRTHITRNAEGRYRVMDVDVDLSVEVTDNDAGRFERCGDLFQDFCIVTESVRRGVPVNVHVTTHPAESAA